MDQTILFQSIYKYYKGPSRRVSFDTREELNDKIDKLKVMIGKLAVKD